MSQQEDLSTYTVRDLFSILNTRQGDRENIRHSLNDQQLADAQVIHFILGTTAIDHGEREMLQLANEATSNLLLGRDVNEVLSEHPDLAEITLGELLGTRLPDNVDSLIQLFPGESVFLPQPVTPGMTEEAGSEPQTPDEIREFLFRQYPPVEAFFNNPGNIRSIHGSERYFLRNDILRLFQRRDGNPVDENSVYQSLFAKLWVRWQDELNRPPKTRELDTQGHPIIVYEDDLQLFLYYFTEAERNHRGRPYEYTLRTEASANEIPFIKKNI